LFGAETLDLDDVEPPRNSSDAGCYSLFLCRFASLAGTSDLPLSEQQIITLMPEKQPSGQAN
jgi:hypothetical protein